MPKPFLPLAVVPKAGKPKLEWFARTQPEEAMAQIIKVRADLIAAGYPKEAVVARTNKEAERWGLPHLPPLA